MPLNFDVAKKEHRLDFGTNENLKFSYGDETYTKDEVSKSLFFKETSSGLNIKERYEPEYHSRMVQAAKTKEWIPTPAEKKQIEKYGYEKATELFSTSRGKYQILPETAYRYTSFAGDVKDLDKDRVQEKIKDELLEKWHSESGGDLEKTIQRWNQGQNYFPTFYKHLKEEKIKKKKPKEQSFLSDFLMPSAEAAEQEGGFRGAGASGEWKSIEEETISQYKTTPLGIVKDIFNVFKSEELSFKEKAQFVTGKLEEEAKNYAALISIVPIAPIYAGAYYTLSKIPRVSDSKLGQFVISQFAEPSEVSVSELGLLGKEVLPYGKETIIINPQQDVKSVLDLSQSLGEMVVAGKIDRIVSGKIFENTLRQFSAKLEKAGYGTGKVTLNVDKVRKVGRGFASGEAIEQNLAVRGMEVPSIVKKAKMTPELMFSKATEGFTAAQKVKPVVVPKAEVPTPGAIVRPPVSPIKPEVAPESAKAPKEPVAREITPKPPIEEPSIEKIKPLIEKEGAEWVGIQKAPGMEDMAVFTDPETKSTLQMSLSEITPENIKGHMEESRAKFKIEPLIEEARGKTLEEFMKSQRKEVIAPNEIRQAFEDAPQKIRDLIDVKNIRFVEDLGGEGGRYEAKNKTIYIEKGEPINETIIHETSHNIIEKFSKEDKLFVQEYIKEIFKERPPGVTDNYLNELKKSADDNFVRGLGGYVNTVEERMADDIAQYLINPNKLSGNLKTLFSKHFGVTKSQLTTLWEQAQEKPLDISKEKGYIISEGKGDYYELSEAERKDLSQQERVSQSISSSSLKVKYKRQGSFQFPQEKIGSPADVAYAFRELKNEAVERFYVLGIKNGSPISIEPISIGTINSALVSPFEPLNLLITKKADSYYLIHNHPSRNVAISTDDKNITRIFESAYEKHNLKFAGHAIINTTEFGFQYPDGSFETLPMPRELLTPKKVTQYSKYIEWLEGRGTAITSGEDVVKFSKSLNFDKENNALILYLSHGNEILMSDVIPNKKISAKNIAEVATQNRAIGVILVNSRLENPQIQNLQRDLRPYPIKVLDDVGIKEEGFTSKLDQGVIREKPTEYVPKTIGVEPSQEIKPFSNFESKKSPISLLDKKMNEVNGLRLSGKLTPQQANIQIQEIKKRKLDYAREKGIAITKTQSGKTRIAIRKSGFYAKKEIETAPIRDVYSQFHSPSGMALMQDGYEKGKDFGIIYKEVWMPTKKSIAESIDFKNKFDNELKALLKKHKFPITKKSGIVLSDMLEKKIRIPGRYKELTKDIRQYMNDKRDLANDVRVKMGKSKIGYIENYIPHIQKTSIWNELVGNDITITDNFDFIIPNQIKNPFAYKRLLKEMMNPERNFFSLVERYNSAIAKDMFINPAIENIKAYNTVLKDKGLFKASKFWDEYIRTGLLGKQHKIDSALSVSPIVRKGLKKWKDILNKAFLTGKISWNIATQPLSYISLTPTEAGFGNAIKAVFKMFNKGIRQSVRQHSVSLKIKSKDILSDAIGEGRGYANRIYRTKIDKWNDMISVISSVEEQLLHQASYIAGLDRAKEIGYTGEDAHMFADLCAERTQSMYNKENRALILNSDITTAAVPFQSFAVELSNHAKEILTKTKGAMRLNKRQRIGKLIRLLIGIWLANQYAKALAGREKTTVGTFIPFAGETVDRLITKVTKKGYVTTRSPVSVIQQIDDLIKAAKNYTKYGDTKKLRKIGITFGPALFGAGGGGQISNLVDGLIADIEGEVKSASGRTLFDIKDLESQIKAPIFGVWATKGGREYWEKRQGKKDKANLN